MTWEEAAADALYLDDDDELGGETTDELLNWLDTHLETGGWRGIQMEASLGLRLMGRPVTAAEIVELLASKQRDYGHDNINRFGIDGIKVRISDKICRLRNLLARGEEASNEAIEDTWIDLIGYATIATMLTNGTFDLPLAADVVVAEHKPLVERKVRALVTWNTTTTSPKYKDEDGDWWWNQVFPFRTDIGTEVVINFPGGQSRYKLVELVDGVDIERERDI